MWMHKEECLQLPLPKTMRGRRKGKRIKVKDIKDDKKDDTVCTNSLSWKNYEQDAQRTEDRRGQEKKNS